MVPVSARDAPRRYPRAVVEERSIIIIDKNDERWLWGHKEEAETAARIAKEIESGLSAIIYARDSIIAFLGDLVDELTSLDVPEEMLAWAIDDTYTDIFRILPRLLDYLSLRATNK